MVRIVPVRGWHPAASGPEADALVCPVYDTLSDADHARFGARPHNAAGFTSRPASLDTAAFLAHASRKLREAQAAGAYRQDPTPSLYVYGLRYNPPPAILEVLPPEGRRAEYLLLGLVGGLDLDATPAEEIALHERVFDDRVQERVALTEATGLSFAPIMVGYTMPDHAVNDLLESTLGLDRRRLSLDGTTRPVAEVRLDGAVHRLWRLDDTAVTSRLTELLRTRRGLILDGHHRFSSAQARKAAGRHPRPLTMFVESRDRALLLLPWHRVVPPTVLTYRDFAAEAPRRFPSAGTLDRAPDVPTLVTLLRSIQQHGQSGFLAVGASQTVVVTAPGRAHEGADYELLHAELEGRRHLDPHDFSFVRSPREAVEAVGSGDGVAFLLPPLTLEGVERTAFDEHRVMAQKSTMFLPKVAEGLIFAPADGPSP